MYDILQLNDMLVPELLDIAEQLKIANPKKLGKQELIYKILDKQAILNSENMDKSKDEKPKKKRIVKTSTSNSTEEAIVESETPAPTEKPKVKKKLKPHQNRHPLRVNPSVIKSPLRKKQTPSRKYLTWLTMMTSLI